MSLVPARHEGRESQCAWPGPPHTPSEGSNSLEKAALEQSHGSDNSGLGAHLASQQLQVGRCQLCDVLSVCSCPRTAAVNVGGQVVDLLTVLVSNLGRSAKQGGGKEADSWQAARWEASCEGHCRTHNSAFRCTSVCSKNNPSLHRERERGGQCGRCTPGVSRVPRHRSTVAARSECAATHVEDDAANGRSSLQCFWGLLASS